MAYTLTLKEPRSKYDQFYTQPDYAVHCFSVSKQWHTDKYIEPCAGSGSFSTLMKDPIELDIDPQLPTTTKCNFLEWSQDLTGYTCVSNPPFGSKNSLALKFVNKLASLNCSVIAVIVPRSFRKATIINKIDRNYELVYDEDTPKSAFTNIDARCCFQVWKRVDIPRQLIDTSGNNPWFDWSSSADYDVAIVYMGKRAGKILDPGEHSAGFVNFVKLKTVTKEQLVEASSKVHWPSLYFNTASIESVNRKEIVDALAPHLSVRPLINTDTTNPWFEWGTVEDHDCSVICSGTRSGQIIDAGPHTQGFVYHIKLKNISRDELSKAADQVDWRPLYRNTASLESLNRYEFFAEVSKILAKEADYVEH